MDEVGTKPPQIAKRIGLPSTTFYDGIRGKSEWKNVFQAIKLAKLMGTTVEYLFDESTPWPEPKQARIVYDHQHEFAAAENLEERARTKKRKAQK